MEFSSGRNLITGPNGAGKTSILEAIFLLGSGHSFKTSSLEPLVQNAAVEFMVVGSLSDATRSATIGLRYSEAEREGRVDGIVISSWSDVAKTFPVQVIDPGVHELLEDGPRRRRIFLDWGLFHVEPSFHETWRRFNRALKQRNAQLKVGYRDFGAWDAELLAHGSALSHFRRTYVDALGVTVREVGNRLLGEEVTIEYQKGWRQSLNFLEALAESRDRDQQRGTTTVGPHRAELILKVGGELAKDRISRGQQKMLACSLILAQQLHRASLSAHSACLLLDDPGAELDTDNLGKLLDIVSELPVQLIATSLGTSDLGLFEDAKKFHVEHGSVKAMA